MDSIDKIGAYAQTELVIPSKTFFRAQPTIIREIIEARNLEELNRKIATGHEICRERGAHMNLGGRHVLNPETGEYEAVDRIRATVESTLVRIGRFIKDIS